MQAMHSDLTETTTREGSGNRTVSRVPAPPRLAVSAATLSTWTPTPKGRIP